MVNFVNLGEIYGRLDNARANDVNIQGARQQQEIGQYKLNQAKQADQEAMAIRDIYKSTGGDLNLTQKKLSELGYFDQANAVGKQITEQQTAQTGLEKDKLANAEKKINLIGQGMNFVLQNPSKENALRVFGNLRGMGALDDTQYQAYVSNLPDDPMQIKQGAETLIRMALDAKSQLPQFKSQDAGGQVINQNVDPVTGAVQEVNRIDKTQTPDSIASNERMARESAANRAVQMRGQDLTNQRAKEKNAIDYSAGGYSNKPLPATALKMQNEALDKLSVASNINADLATIEGKIKNGKLSFGPMSNLMNKGLNMAGMSTEESRNFATFKSTLEKLRNDSLRLNTGVQTDGDAQRAWNELFENINDTAFVQQRLIEIREINKRGAELQKLQVENIRGNYNAPPVDFSRYEKGSALEKPSQIIPKGEQMPASGGWSVRKVN